MGETWEVENELVETKFCLRFVREEPSRASQSDSGKGHHFENVDGRRLDSPRRLRGWHPFVWKKKILNHRFHRWHRLKRKTKNLNQWKSAKSVVEPIYEGLLKRVRITRNPPLFFNELDFFKHFIIQKLSGKNVNIADPTSWVVKNDEAVFGYYSMKLPSTAQLSRPSGKVMLEGKLREVVIRVDPEIEGDRPWCL